MKIYSLFLLSFFIILLFSGCGSSDGLSVQGNLYTLSGVVTAKDGVTPLSGVSLTLFPETIQSSGINSSYLSTFTTLSDGIFTFAGLPAGKYILQVSKDGYVPFRYRNISITSSNENMSIDFYTVAEWNTFLGASHTYSGTSGYMIVTPRVSETDKTIIPGVTMKITPSDGITAGYIDGDLVDWTGISTFPAALDDLTGGFFEGLTPSLTYSVESSFGGTKKTLSNIVPLAGYVDICDVFIGSVQTYTLSGKVTEFLLTTAVDGVNVALSYEGAVQSSFAYQVTTGADGSYTFTGVPSGTYTVTITDTAVPATAIPIKYHNVVINGNTTKDFEIVGDAVDWNDRSGVGHTYDSAKGYIIIRTFSSSTPLATVTFLDLAQGAKGFFITEPTPDPNFPLTYIVSWSPATTATDVYGRAVFDGLTPGTNYTVTGTYNATNQSVNATTEYGVFEVYDMNF